MRNINLISLAFSFFFFSACSFASNLESNNVAMEPANWTVESEEFKFEEHLGAQSLFLPSGFALLNDVDFHNGTIEFDIAFPQGRGFPGLMFRIQDQGNYEELYIRPHQSGNPDANQYTPVFNQLAGWQLYHGDGHGAPIKYKYDAWNHVKLVINGTAGEVYINDMETPLFQIHELKHGDAQGPIALKGNANSHFANFTYSLEDDPELKLPVAELPAIEKQVIQSYQVSAAIEDGKVLGKSTIDLQNYGDLDWSSLECEYTGTINIAKKVARTEGKNTSLVRFNVVSESAQMKRLDFGYSDVAQVFVNGKAIYLGENRFRSRDYRYLGTIGFFDSVFLDLKEGDNEIVIAVNEGFGGWGFRSKLEDLDGIELK